MKFFLLLLLKLHLGPLYACLVVNQSQLFLPWSSLIMATPTHLYPGVNLALREMPERELSFKDDYLFYPIGFPEYHGSKSAVMPVKEVAMMILMDASTDKPDWHRKVFDETIVQKWREEARQQSEDSLYARILQDKLGEGPRKPRDRIITDAAYFAQSGLIPTLDGPGNTIIKSGSFIDETLHRDLDRACYTLWKDQEGNVDWYSRSNDMVQNLIHPSMYNFVYDRSPFIQEEIVGVSNALVFMGQGELVRGQTPLVLPEYWSDKYQWLPANVGFREDGSADFTSYVNNLHPTKFPEIYRTIERLVDRVIPAWDHCLREVPRFGDESSAGEISQAEILLRRCCFMWLMNGSDEDDDLWTPEFDVDEFLHKDVQLSHQELRDLEEECYHDAEEPVEFDEDEYQRRMNEGLPPLTPNVDDETMAEVKWVKYRDAILPDPKPFEEADYAPKQILREKFKKDGLQIIFSAGSWHLEDQMNEKIAATALYYFDSENAGQDGYNYLERVYGTDLGTQVGFSRSCVQSYGDVGTPEGRLLAFPTSFNTVFPLSSDKIRRSRDIDASSPFGWLIHTGESFRRRMCRLSKRIGGLEVVKCLGALWTLRKRGRIG
ncbi:hypothetical protein DER46DRAFT_627874 [Fusarium sp. MPI-SDFR-AT-0072]|nr:hypothetical protein DER46DRAFT_627874 [Fusarium sp. MPI-SDFR-AT-0072]